jgi:hypothetical protein
VRQSCVYETQTCEYNGPGSLTADVYARPRIYASWASSAVVQTIVNGYGYFDQVKKALPTNCSLDIIAAVQYVDNALSGSNTSLLQDIGEKITSDEDYDDIPEMMQSPFELFQASHSFENELDILPTQLYRRLG